MNRRSFLRLLGLAAPALVIDPERLLWVPGQRTFFLPSVKPIRLVFHPDAFAMVMKPLTLEGVRLGSTVRVRLPQRYALNSPEYFVPNSVVVTHKGSDTIVPITITDRVTGWQA